MSLWVREWWGRMIGIACDRGKQGKLRERVSNWIYQSSQFWFHIKSSHSLPSLSKKHISLCQLLTIELSVAEFKSPGCDSCGPWSGVSQRAGQTFLPALWLTMGTITSATARHSADERKRRSGGLFSESVNYLAGYIACSAFPFFLRFPFLLWPHCLTFEKHYMVWNTTLSTLSCAWQRCPRIV